MFDHSIDLETYDKSADAKILSIGVTKFDIHAGVIIDSRYYKLDYKAQVDRSEGRGTPEWWAEQDPDVLQEATSGTVPLSKALSDLYNFIQEGDRVWGNGSSFDISILDHAYDYNTPWAFYNVRDMRTIVWLAEQYGFNKHAIKRVGEQHNALLDSRYQAIVISSAYLHLHRATLGLHNEI